MTLTLPYFLLALGVGAALLAFWFVVRYPDRGPANMRGALIHVGIAFAIGWFAPDDLPSNVAFANARQLLDDWRRGGRGPGV